MTKEQQLKTPWAEQTLNDRFGGKKSVAWFFKEKVIFFEKAAISERTRSTTQFTILLTDCRIVHCASNKSLSKT